MSMRLRRTFVLEQPRLKIRGQYQRYTDLSVPVHRPTVLYYSCTCRYVQSRSTGGYSSQERRYAVRVAASTQCVAAGMATIRRRKGGGVEGAEAEAAGSEAAAEVAAGAGGALRVAG